MGSTTTGATSDVEIAYLFRAPEIQFCVVPIVVIMVGFFIGIMAYCVYRSRTDKEVEVLYHSNKQMKNQQDELNRTKEMEDIIYVHAPISYGTNEIVEMQTGHSKGLDRLGRGSFKIKPSAYRMATLFMSGLAGAWVRWSECYSKYTKFTFRKTIVDGKTYFHIFSADYPKYYVKMGKTSFWVSCVKGNPEGCNDATWEIKCGDYNNDYCYVLCPKDSNGNYLSAGSTYRMHGRRGDINDRSMFFIH